MNNIYKIRSEMIREKIGSVIGKKVVIVCCGNLGKELCDCLIENNIEPECFFDNSIKKIGDKILGIPIEPISNKGDGYIYMIANNNIIDRENISIQLRNKGILQKNIMEISYDDAWEFWKNLPESKYEEEISKLYFDVFGEAMNWDKPRRYNEIINYEKVNAIDNDRKKVLADKYLAREYVANMIGEEHLVEYLGVWDSGEDIDFDSLPESFVLKTNNGSGRNILVKNKRSINRKNVILMLNHWLSMDYGYQGLALNYKGIVPKIICEEYLEGLAETVYDYDVFCFRGEPRYIWVISGSHRSNAKASFYDTNWNKLESVSYGYPYDPDVVPKPDQLEDILEYSKKLCKDFKHCRVDWYVMPEGRILFSEITFATWGGLKHFVPEEWDQKFGQMILGEL